MSPPPSTWEAPQISLHWALITLDHQVQPCLLQFSPSAPLLLNGIIKPHEPSPCFGEKTLYINTYTYSHTHIPLGPETIAVGCRHKVLGLAQRFSRVPSLSGALAVPF